MCFSVEMEYCLNIINGSKKGQRLIVHQILRKWARGGDVGSVEWLEHGDMKYKMNFGLRWEG